MLGREMVAVARYERLGERPDAEVAFFVDDAHHGKGLGTLMLEYLAAAARDQALTGFVASVLPENFRMLGVFRSAGFDIKTSYADGVIDVKLGIDVTDEASSVISDRDRLARARSVARILEPRTVAIVGASRKPGTLGHELVRHAAAGRRADGQGARVVAVNPKANEIAGVRSYPTIAAAADALRSPSDAADASRSPSGTADPSLSGTGESNESDYGSDDAPLDLAVIAVRAERANEIVAECAHVGVRGLLIISAGFSDFGGLGAELERRLVEVARNNGMRLIGPAAFGIVNTDPAVDLSVVFEPVPVVAGRVGLASQSGPLGAALLDQLRMRGVGVSTFVGVGNRADVSVNDLLDYWSLDEATDVVVLYVENFGNLRNFSSTAQRTSASKPIITIRPGSQEETELLRQAGVILVDEVSQLVVQAQLAGTQPLPRGKRVVIVSNTASLARLAAGACRRHGLQVVTPDSVSDIARDGAVLIADIDSGSLRPNSRTDTYERTVVAAAVADEADMVMLALAPTAGLEPAALESLVDSVNRSIDKPMVAVGLRDDADAIQVDGIPVFTFPDEAAQALSRHAGYGQWRRASARRQRSRVGIGVETESDDDRDDVDAETLIENALAGRESAQLTLASPHLAPLMRALGLPLAEWGPAADVDEAVELAERIGYPVVLKAANLGLRSIGESGGTAIDIHNRSDLIATYERMSDQLGTAMRTAVVQRMVGSTGAIRVELLRDNSFGAMLAIGPGGLALTNMLPIARRFLPIDDAMARELVAEVKRQPIFADLAPESEQALVELIGVLAASADTSPVLARITLNPILLSGDTAVATDVEIALRRTSPDWLADVRHI
jgi:acyl-CoA synthetase (NDP forming)